MKPAFTATAPARVTYAVVASAAGKLLVGLTSQKQICRVAFMRNCGVRDIVAEWSSEWPRTVFTRGKIGADWQKRPILMTGTPFQQAVWRVMAKIPPGSVTTYGGIAHYIGNPRAARAVGAACGANPVPYLIPCHRVIAGNGGLGGFSGGLEIKRKLLGIEKFALAS